MTTTHVLRIEDGGRDLAELRSRVWQWSRRNLYWLLGDDAGHVVALRHGLDELEAKALERAPAGTLNVVEAESAPAGDPVDFHHAMLLSAVSLRPSLDELLARYEVVLAEDTPTVSRLLEDEAFSSGLSGALAVKLREAVGRPLEVLANDPGEPLPAPMVVTLFRVDDLPLAAPLEKFSSVDESTRGCAAWLHMGEADLPDVFEAIPEAAMDEGAMASLFALMNALAPSFAVAPFHFLFEQGRMMRTLSTHTSATLEEIAAFYESQGVRVWSGEQALRYASHWYQCDTHPPRDDGPSWATPETWNEAFPPRSTASERKLLQERVGAAEGEFWSRVRVSGGEPLDRFACVRAALIEAGMTDETIFASLVPWLLQTHKPGPWVMHLAIAIHSCPEIREALRDAGFTEPHLEHLRGLLEGYFRYRNVAPFALKMRCAERSALTGSQVPQEVLDLLTEALPIRTANFALHVHGEVRQSDRGLEATLRMINYDPDGSVRDLAEQQVVLLAEPDHMSRLPILRQRLQAVAAQDFPAGTMPVDLLGDGPEAPTIACDDPEPWNDDVAAQAQARLTELRASDWLEARRFEAELLGKHGAPAACWWVTQYLTNAKATLLAEAPSSCPWRFRGSIEATINAFWEPVVSEVPAQVRLLAERTRYLIALHDDSGHRLVHLFDHYGMDTHGVGCLAGGPAEPEPQATARMREVGWSIPEPLKRLYLVHDGLSTTPSLGDGIEPSRRLEDLGELMESIDVEEPEGYAWRDLLVYCPDGGGNAQCFHRNRKDARVDVTVDWDHETREISADGVSFWSHLQRWMDQVFDE